MSDPAADNRRPLKSRGTAWARALAAGCARAGIGPDQISAMSVVCAGLGATALLSAGLIGGGWRWIFLLAAATCIQLRLLCNLLDGMVAVEHGRGGTAGPIWNELPDRIADGLFLVAAGYAAALPGGPALGWVAAWLAVLTAYVRELGRGLGYPADFSGPMAKPHRMAALTVTCAVAAFEPLWGWTGESLLLGLAVIVIGAAATVARRTRALARRLAA